MLGDPVMPVPQNVAVPDMLVPVKVGAVESAAVTPVRALPLPDENERTPLSETVALQPVRKLPELGDTVTFGLDTVPTGFNVDVSTVPVGLESFQPLKVISGSTSARLMLRFGEAAEIPPDGVNLPVNVVELPVQDVPTARLLVVEPSTRVKFAV